MTSWTAIRTLIIGAIFLAPVSAAQAVVVDFTDANEWGNLASDGGAFGKSTYQSLTLYNGTTVTAEASTVGINDVGLYWDDKDGLGVNPNKTNSTTSYEWDEIEGKDVLTIVFDRTIILNSIGISDLFIEKRNHEFTEFGSYITSDGDTDQFFAVEKTGQGSGNGERLLAGLNLKLDSISFSAIGKEINGEDHEFSLQYLDFSEVPVPAAFWMFGTALIGFVAFSRRIKV